MSDFKSYLIRLGSRYPQLRTHLFDVIEAEEMYQKSKKRMSSQKRESAHFDERERKDNPYWPFDTWEEWYDRVHLGNPPPPPTEEELVEREEARQMGIERRKKEREMYKRMTSALQKSVEALKKDLERKTGLRVEIKDKFKGDLRSELRIKHPEGLDLGLDLAVDEEYLRMSLSLKPKRWIQNTAVKPSMNLFRAVSEHTKFRLREIEKVPAKIKDSSRVAQKMVEKALDLLDQSMGSGKK